MNKNMFILGGGNVLGQLIPLLSLPLLTRLFTTNDFGLLGGFLATMSLLSGFFSGRYELALIIEKDKGKQISVYSATILIICATTITSLVLIYSYEHIYESSTNLGELLYLAPISALFVSIIELNNNWFNKCGDYSRIVTTNLWQRFSCELSSITCGVLKYSGAGLIFSQILSQIISIIYNYKRLPKLDFNLKDIKWVLKKYRNFPLYSMPFSLSAISGRELLVLILTFNIGLEAAGAFLLARKIMMAPIGILSSSVGRVFYKDASDTKNLTELKELFTSITITLIKIFTLPVIILAWQAESFFTIIFGDQWNLSGKIFIILTPTVLLMIITSWAKKIFELTNNQKIAFKIQFVFDFTKVITVFATSVATNNVLIIIYVFSFFTIVQHFTLLYALLKLIEYNSFYTYKLIKELVVNFFLAVLIIAIDFFILGTNYSLLFFLVSVLIITLFRIKSLL